jgi:hypothetical protein
MIPETVKTKIEAFETNAKDLAEYLTTTIMGFQA